MQDAWVRSIFRVNFWCSLPLASLSSSSVASGIDKKKFEMSHTEILCSSDEYDHTQLADFLQELPSPLRVNSS